MEPVPTWRLDLEAARVRRYAGITGRRLVLRKRLDYFTERYGEAQRAFPAPAAYETCNRVNQERDPLFRELWQLEKGLSVTERYWFPVRYTTEEFPSAVSVNGLRPEGG